MDEFYDLTGKQRKYMGDKEVSLDKPQFALTTKDNALSRANESPAKVREVMNDKDDTLNKAQEALSIKKEATKEAEETLKIVGIE